MNSPREVMAQLTAELEQVVAGSDKPLRFMEVCGTHTVSAFRSGVHSLMPDGVRLVSGPGCPVCVTAQRYIDALIDLGRRDGMTIATYGDMLRVTGAGGSLELVRSEGADVRVVTSSMEALEIARAEPDRQVVFAAVGFETTAPATAAVVLAAQRQAVPNFTVLAAHKQVLPAMQTLLADPDIPIDGFLCPGHVSVVIGAEAYRPIVEMYSRPCVIAGFEAVQMMEGILHLARQVTAGEARLENLYPTVVGDQPQPHAKALIARVFEPADAAWRALGVMKESGLNLRAEFAAFDAFQRFDLVLGEDEDPPGCRCGEVITGRCGPLDCGLFGGVCTPVTPIGPCMVSSEGTCQAWFKYRRHEMRAGVGA
jgi:hydrogenase expression/formation protein HypD